MPALSALRTLKSTRLGRTLSSIAHTFRGSEEPTQPPLADTWRRFAGADALGEAVGATLPPAPSMLYLVSPIERSGHNFVASLLEKHPDIAAPTGPALPGEHHLLHAAPDLVHYAVRTVERQSGWIEGGPDAQGRQVALLLQTIGGALVNYYQSFLPAGKTLLLKPPSTEHLPDFLALFPTSTLVCLTRDGRDTVASYVKTWGEEHFEEAARTWAARTDLMLDLIEAHPERTHWIKYEDAHLHGPETVTALLTACGLSVDDYPFEAVEDVPIIGSSTHSVSEEGTVDWAIKPKRREAASFSPVGRWTAWSMRGCLISTAIAS